MKSPLDPTRALASGLARIRAEFQVPAAFPPEVLAAAASAAACGVAADLAAERHGAAGMIARDLIESLSLALG
jgi:NAD(P)H-hydrate repair Nnr-like enzyme with NAD(P)H-hydrate dehydratase domain